MKTTKRLRIKTWLCERLLPVYLREELLEENQRLRRKIDMQKREIEELNAYIDGLLDAMSRQPKIVIKNEKL